MHFYFLNLNRNKIARAVLSAFLAAGVLNWAFAPNFPIYAQEAPAEQIEAPAETPPKTVIETGNAVAETDTQNQTNTNQINTEPQPEPQEEIAQEQTLEASRPETESGINLEIQNENEAEIDNISATGASTGENEIASSSEAVITTGAAVATSDTTTVTNTNIIDSNASIIAGSDFLGDSSFDLRNSFGSGNGSGCDSCIESVEITGQNIATVTTEAAVSATTGGNTASSTDSSAIITGDAYAAANVVNIVNTNIVKSNYLLVVFNNFGDWSGDLILPNGNFFANFLSLFNPELCQNCGRVSLSNNNQSEVANSVSVFAETGSNAANGGKTDIRTGNAHSISNVQNQINENIYGLSSFRLLIKVSDGWEGSVFNLPENISWKQTTDGIVFYNGEEPEPEGGIGVEESQTDISVLNRNSASVANEVGVSASTGGNNANGESAYIETGDAYAAANVVNIINTNIVSSNWVRAMINVLGNWRGNISFGQPDLWVGTIAEADKNIKPGSTITFTSTVKNNGDATASGIKVKVEPQSPFLLINGDKEWFLSPLAPGQSSQISYSAYIAPGMYVGTTNLPSKISVSLTETDANQEDNTDAITISAFTEGTILLPYSSRSSTYPNLQVSKSHILPSAVVVNGKETVTIGDPVDYEIIIKNNGGKAFEGVLVDQLIDKNGEIVNEQFWNLGEILEDEEITVTYTMRFSASSTPGLYTNKAWVEALTGEFLGDEFAGEKISSNIATDKVIVRELPELPKLPTQTQPPTKENNIVEITKKEISQLDWEVEYTGLEEEYIEGLCQDSQKSFGFKNKFGIAEVILTSLSFVLIIKRGKNT